LNEAKAAERGREKGEKKKKAAKLAQGTAAEYSSQVKKNGYLVRNTQTEKKERGPKKKKKSNASRENQKGADSATLDGG